MASARRKAEDYPTQVVTFRNLGLVVSMNGRVSPVTIAIDGTAKDFYATAQELQFRPRPASLTVHLQNGARPTAPASPPIPPRASMRAWR